jgi:hypothetical protein
MQKGSNGSVQDSISKPVMLALITALVVGIVAPLMVPHLAHPSMIYHIILHIASLTIAVFLSIVSFLAYSRSTGSRLLLMALGFSALGMVELVYLLEASGMIVMTSIPAINIELPHIILLIMLSLFGLGVLKVNK